MKGVWTLESDQNSAHAVLIFCPGYNFEISFLVLTLKWWEIAVRPIRSVFAPLTIHRNALAAGARSRTPLDQLP